MKMLRFGLICSCIWAIAGISSAKASSSPRVFRGDGVGQSVTLSPDGNLLATCADFNLHDNSVETQKAVVKLWNARTGTLIRTLTQGNINPSAVRFSPDGRTLLMSGAFQNHNQFGEGVLFFYHVADGKLSRTQRLPKSWPTSFEYSNDGKSLVVSEIEKTKISTASQQFSGRIVWRDVVNGAVRRSVSLGQNRAANSLALSPNGQTLAVVVIKMAGDDVSSSLQLLNAKSGKLLRSENEGAGVGVVVWSPDGKMVAVSTGGRRGARIMRGEIRLRHARSGALLKTLHGVEGTINALQFASNNILFSGGWDGIVRRWNVKSGVAQNLQFPGAEVTALAMSRNKTFLASAQWDSTSKLWNVADTTGTRVNVPITLYSKNDVLQIAHSSKGFPFYSLNQLNLTQHLPLRHPKEHEIFSVDDIVRETLSRMIASPDGKIVIVQSILVNSADEVGNESRSDMMEPDSPLIRVLDVQNGAALHTLKPRGSLGLAISLDGKLLATSYQELNRNFSLRERGVEIWDLASGSLSKTIVIQSQENDLGFGELAWTRDGHLIVAQKAGIELWDVGSTKLLRTLTIDVKFPIADFRLSPDGKKLAASGEEYSFDDLTSQSVLGESVQVWDMSNGNSIRVLDGLGGTVSGISWSKDSAHLAVATNRTNIAGFEGKTSGALRIFDMSGAHRTLISNADQIYDAQFAPDTNTLHVSYGRFTMSGGVTDLQIWTLPWLK